MFIRIVKLRFHEDKIEAFLNNFEDENLQNLLQAHNIEQVKNLSTKHFY